MCVIYVRFRAVSLELNQGCDKETTKCGLASPENSGRYSAAFIVLV